MSFKTRLKLIHWLILLQLISFCKNDEKDPVVIELFGTGDLSFRDKILNVTSQHMSSSTEDLLVLFKEEKLFYQQLLELKDVEVQDQKVKLYLQLVDFDLNAKDENYVFHPINSFHMMTRTSTWIPKLKKHFPDLKFSINLPSTTEASLRSARGLADIQEFYNLDVMDLIGGNIKDPKTGYVFSAKSNLTSVEVLKVATAAKSANYFDNHVDWAQAALKAAKLEGKSDKFLKSIKKIIKDGKSAHDQIYFELAMDKSMKIAIRTKEVPFDSNTLTKSFEAKRAKIRSKYINNFNSLNINRAKHWMNTDLPNRMTIFYRDRVQQLCSDTYTRPAWLDKDLKCLFLHHNNPYLKLAPFKYERLNLEPEVGLIHNFVSIKEVNDVKSEASGKMKSTPYAKGKATESYSKERTSKIMYMNEKRVAQAMKVAKKIQLATRFKLYSDRYASENFQVMNYGIGGTISPHVDSLGDDYEHSTERLELGGLRITTFMVYLSDVILGGHTVFPQIGVSVKPKLGSALFWFNVSPSMTFDSRIYHMGCPVLIGNKWIANKWIKLLAQFKNYPCTDSNQSYFSIFH